MKVWRVMSRGRVVVAVWVLFGISALAMFGWPGLTGAVSRACHGRNALDVRSEWTAADARDLVTACGSEGRAAYLRLELLDLVYPLFCGLALLLVSALLIRRLPGRRWRLLLIPAIAMTLLDYSENAAVWNILSTWPAVGDLPAHLGGAATAAKRAAGLAAYLTVPLLLLTVGLDRLRVRSRPLPSHSPSAVPDRECWGTVPKSDAEAAVHRLRKSADGEQNTQHSEARGQRSHAPSFQRVPAGEVPHGVHREEHGEAPAGQGQRRAPRRGAGHPTAKKEQPADRDQNNGGDQAGSPIPARQPPVGQRRAAAVGGGRPRGAGGEPQLEGRTEQQQAAGSDGQALGHGG